MSIYEFIVKDRNQEDVSLSIYQGKVLLIVNTATECGFTPQYKELQEIYETYHSQGLEILDFPCNQFGEQAKGSDEEIHAFCTGRFGITFPQFSKVDVKGENAIPLFKWLEKNTTFKGFDMNPTGMMMTQMLKKVDKNFKMTNEVKWNFTKFLIDREGKVVGRFEPTSPMRKLEAKIKEII